MDSIPHEIVILVMKHMEDINTLHNFSQSAKRYYRILRLYGDITTCVVMRQIGETAKDALFLATNRASGANSETERRSRMISFLTNTHVPDVLPQDTLKLMLQGARAINYLANTFIDCMAQKLWHDTIQGDLPLTDLSYTHSRMRIVLYRYWFFCELYRQFKPIRPWLFWESNLDPETIWTFYDKLPSWQWYEMIFFEGYFFPEIMKQVCTECRDNGSCYGQLHGFLFGQGPIKIASVLRGDKILNRRYDDFHELHSGSLTVGLRGGLTRGISSWYAKRSIVLPAIDSAEGALLRQCPEWVIFNPAALYPSHRNVLRKLM